LSGDAEEAKANLQTLRHDYPLNPTVWWLQWQSEGSDEALNAWRDICGGRDINALLTAGQLLSWGMKTEAIGVLEKLACERTLPLLLQASLLTESDRAPLIARAIDAFPRFVRFPNTLDEVDALNILRKVRLPVICWPVSTTVSAMTKKRWRSGSSAWRWTTAWLMPGVVSPYTPGISNRMKRSPPVISTLPAVYYPTTRVCCLSVICWQNLRGHAAKSTDTAGG
jgi:hypothetical protein